MAYSDYGAFVYLNGERQKDLEDCEFNGNLCHGLIKTKDYCVVCYKQGLPQLYKVNGDKVENIDYYNDFEIDYFDYEPFTYSVDGYIFHFVSKPLWTSKPHYSVEVKTPNGDLWSCDYDYWYGAGFD